MTANTVEALAIGRTYFKKSRRAEGRFLKPVSNRKIGKKGERISRGRWRGFAIYTATLEERATCPRTCPHWGDCYGNGMRFAHRMEHGPALEKRLPAEIAELARKHPEGFAVRLHVLGDFYSRRYVALWARMLRKYPALHVWGYTARLPGTPIGDAIAAIRGPRFVVRWSGGGTLPLSANPEGFAAPAFTCPEQTGKAKSCAACGACWATLRAVRFIDHENLISIQ